MILFICTVFSVRLSVSASAYAHTPLDRSGTLQSALNLGSLGNSDKHAFGYCHQTKAQKLLGFARVGIPLTRQTGCLQPNGGK